MAHTVYALGTDTLYDNKVKQYNSKYAVSPISNSSDISIFKTDINNGINELSDTNKVVSIPELLIDDEDELKSKDDNKNKISSEGDISIYELVLEDIEAQLNKLINEYTTENNSKTGLGAVWNSIQGVFGAGSKGKINNYSELLSYCEELKNNPDENKIQELYKKVFNEEINIDTFQESVDLINNYNDYFEIDGEKFSKNDIIIALSTQAQELNNDFSETIKSQGWISKGISWLNNNLLGIGTTQNMTIAQIENHQQLIAQLLETQDLIEFASLYKSITGEDLSNKSLSSLLNGELKIENSKASESITDYENTNENIKNTASAVATGAIAATTGPLVALLIGAEISVGVGMIDAATKDNNENAKKNLTDYIEGDMVKDALVGSINGLTGKLGNMAANKLAATLAAKSATAITETTSAAIKGSLTGQRFLTEFTDGALNAGLSSAAEYLIDSASGKNGNFTNSDGKLIDKDGNLALINNFEENFDIKEMGEQVLLSTLMGGVMNVGMSEGMRFAAKGIENIRLQKNSFKVLPEGDSAIKTGDIVRLSNSNKIGIQLKDGTIQELNISEKTLKQLFPDGETLKVSQGQVGDCYLVASIYSLMEDSKTRPYVLQCFCEDAKGNITVSFKEGTTSFTLKNGQLMSDIIESSKIQSGSKGAQMLEYLYGLELLEEESKDISKQIADILHSQGFANSKIDLINSILAKEGQVIDIDGLKLSIDNLEVADDIKVGDFYSQYRQSYYDLFLTEDNSAVDFVKLRKHLTKLDDILTANQNKINDLNSKLVSFGNPAEEVKLRGDGGCMDNVFKKFGLKVEYISSATKAVDLLSNSADEYVFGGGTKGSKDTKFLNKKLDILEWHAYSITPFQNESGEIILRITNPHHTNKHTNITIEEFKQYFDHLCIAKK